MNSKYFFRGNDYSKLYDQFGTIELSKCICCDSTKIEKWVEFNGFKADICKNCGFIFMNPQLSITGLQEFYCNYIGETRLNNCKKMKQRSFQYKMDVNILKRFAENGKLLDIGCSGGYFLKEIPDTFEKFGTELDPFAIELAKKNLNISSRNLYLGDVLDCSFSVSSFDVITMRGVIEHVPEPRKTIEKISSLMKSGALFYICATPNGASFSASLYKKDWNLFHPIEHLWHFSEKNLSLLTNDYDLKLIWSEYPYIGTPYEKINDDINLINKKIENNKLNKIDNTISPPFFENMMSLIYRKL